MRESIGETCMESVMYCMQVSHDNPLFSNLYIELY